MSNINMSNLRDMSDLQLEDVEDYSAEYPTVEEDIRTTAENDVQKRRGIVSAFCLSNRKPISIAAGFFLVVFGIALISNSGSEVVVLPSAGQHAPLILVDPESVDHVVARPLLSDLKGMYERHNLTKSVLDESNGNDTPERRAYLWLASQYNPDDGIEHSIRMARYALAVFYYSTNGVAHKFEENPKTWLTATNWLSSSHYCDWKGIVCNENMHVTSIELERNNLTGSPPIELLLLRDKLVTLDLSSNLIFMKGDKFDVFKQLKSLETLLMDDNFLEHKAGLPPQMHHLANLKKMRLSYNLFEGHLDKSKVLESMSKLTHLEIESNFLTGTMPSHIGSMNNLVYLYLRRNSMTFNLDFVKAGKMQKLFAIWIDSNKITGAIPTEMGLLTNLATFSATNATLTGTIPTEMGKMKSLKRLWLYNNKLTGGIPEQLKNLPELEVLEVHNNELKGDMPEGICQVIDSADYINKSLTSDCSDGTVNCAESCCTKCF